MSKLEMLAKLQSSGVMSKFEKHPIWQEAFELYWSLTGDYDLKMGCGTCYKKILEWLRK